MKYKIFLFYSFSYDIIIIRIGGIYLIVNFINICKYLYLLIKSLFLFIFDFIRCFFLGFYVSFFSLFKFFFLGLFTVISLIPKYFIIGIRIIFKKEKWKSEYFSKAILGLSICVYLICVFIISRWISQNIRIKLMSEQIINDTNLVTNIPIEGEQNGNVDITDDNQSDINDTNPNYKVYDYEKYKDVSYLSVDFSQLIKQNDDTVGWLYINGTNINYPFVQGEDNSYYLTHSFDKKKSWAGWIFGDYRNNMDNLKTNTIIYGHNVLNKNLFGTLPRVLKKSWYTNQDNLLIKMSTPKKKTIWKIFSIYKIEPEAYYLRTVFEDDEHELFLKTIKDRSIYDFGDILTMQDKILTLSTCDNSGDFRIVVHARLVSSN